MRNSPLQLKLPMTKTGNVVNCKTNRTLQVVIDFLKPLRHDMYDVPSETKFFNEFKRSLGPFWEHIDGYTGYSENSLFEQAGYFRSCSYETGKPKVLARLVVSFYRYLALNHPEQEYFKDAVKMPLRLLNNYYCHNYLYEGWSFVPFSPSVKYNNEEKTVVVLHGFNRHSTRFAEEDFALIHLDKIKEPFFRRLFFEYMMSSATHFIECLSMHPGSLAPILNDMTNIKSANMSFDSSLQRWTIQEGKLLKRIIDGGVSTSNQSRTKPIAIGTKNNRIGFFRRWFQWAEERGEMSFERTFFDCFIQYEEPAKRSARPIPSEDVNRIMELAKRKGEADPYRRLLYIVLRLIHQTYFRPSDILGLKTSSIEESLSQGIYILRHKTKTSKTNKQVDGITKFDHALLSEAIALTKELREQTTNLTLKDNIFLYRRKSGIIDVIKCYAITNHITSLSKELGLSKNYSAYNLRYTYMTKVYENAVINDLSEAEIQVQTKHVKLSTTMVYVKKKRSDYFKAMNQVMLEDVQLDVTPKVVDEMPANTQELGEREGGCGRCRAANCMYKTILPCITCDNFVTTPEYEPFFERMIEEIDLQMEGVQFQHDREDLVTMKEIYVAFLIEIDKHKNNG